jgi:hypothetical protein
MFILLKFIFIFRISNYSKMSWKRQHLEKQQEEEENNHSMAGINEECPSNCEDNGNEVAELKLKIRDENDGDEGPPRKITKNVRGQIRKYVYVKSVKSMEELDKFRFKVIAK